MKGQDHTAAPDGRQRQAGVTPLLVAAKKGDSMMVQALIQAKADQNVQDSTGQPFHFFQRQIALKEEEEARARAAYAEEYRAAAARERAAATLRGGYFFGDGG